MNTALGHEHGKRKGKLMAAGERAYNWEKVSKDGKEFHTFIS